MLNSLLLHLDGAQPAQSLIELGVQIATAQGARLRGLTLLDTRAIGATSTCESALTCCREFRRLQDVAESQSQVRAQLSSVCAAAEVDFDIRREKGDPLEILPREAQFHDLTITAVPRAAAVKDYESAFSGPEALNLLGCGVRPLLVLRTPLEPVQRVLLASDGAPAAMSAIRDFLRHDLFPNAELRLLAIGETDARAKELLREFADYVRQQRKHFECGWLRGSSQNSLLNYATKWEADLVVTGYWRQNALLRPLWPQPAEQILRSSDMALFASG
ncbi:universal stress protein [Anatilimnocola floriformis]|uniref:universal stress protein n=1 Tax=Anatilimnocola floriformis TaxID=2948575 RepID=UPI0020C522B9|nr:universal stress protein [Anatilimnocola floriformis]